MADNISSRLATARAGIRGAGRRAAPTAAGALGAGLGKGLLKGVLDRETKAAAKEERGFRAEQNRLSRKSALDIAGIRTRPPKGADAFKFFEDTRDTLINKGFLSLDEATEESRKSTGQLFTDEQLSKVSDKFRLFINPLQKKKEKGAGGDDQTRGLLSKLIDPQTPTQRTVSGAASVLSPFGIGPLVGASALRNRFGGGAPAEQAPAAAQPDVGGIVQALKSQGFNDQEIEAELQRRNLR